MKIYNIITGLFYLAFVVFSLVFLRAQMTTNFFFGFILGIVVCSLIEKISYFLEK